MIQVHYVDISAVMLCYMLHKKNKQARIVWSYWGSDLYRNNSVALHLIKKFQPIVSCYTFCSSSLINKFVSIYGEHGSMQYVDFGVTAYDEIDSEQEKTDYKKKNKKIFGFPEEKYVVALGYNGGENQQHIKMIHSFRDLDEEIKDKIHLFLHFAYGISNDNYIREVTDEVKKSGCTYTINCDFMDCHEIAKLRTSVDVFVHAQTTDALSSSMLEYIYSGVIVLNASWLVYPDLDTRGIDYIKFDDFEQLTSRITELIQNIETYKKHTNENKSALYKMNSWNAVKERWYKALGEI
jgi:glycosyltransferase involved in cell wall biosynthesis